MGVIRGAKILLRRDFRENWEKVSDKVISNGELIIVQDYDENGNAVVAFKLGDGKSSYKDLPFVPLLDAINNGYIYWGNTTLNNGKLSIALMDKEENLKKKHILSKNQIFDLKFKYADIFPEDENGKKIENWWEDSINWMNVSMNKEISIDFVREFKDQLIWETLCYYSNLSEEIMREFSDRLNWSTISSKQKLSESFIRDFKEKLNWNCIPYYQSLSEEFIDEMKKEGYIK